MIMASASHQQVDIFLSDFRLSHLLCPGGFGVQRCEGGVLYSVMYAREFDVEGFVPFWRCCQSAQDFSLGEMSRSPSVGAGQRDTQPSWWTNPEFQCDRPQADACDTPPRCRGQKKIDKLPQNRKGKKKAMRQNHSPWCWQLLTRWPLTQASQAYFSPLMSMVAGNRGDYSRVSVPVPSVKRGLPRSSTTRWRVGYWEGGKGEEATTRSEWFVTAPIRSGACLFFFGGLE